MNINYKLQVFRKMFELKEGGNEELTYN